MVSARRLIQAGIGGVVLFLVVITALSATRADYDSIRHFISILSLGPGGWAQVANFIVGGVLMGALGVGLGRSWSDGPGGHWIPRLVTLAGVGLVGCGVFIPDPSLAYPPGTPNQLVTPLTWHGAIHYASAGLITAALAGAVLLAIRRGLAIGSAALVAASIGTAVVVLGACTLVLLGASFDLTKVTGLLERIGVYVAWLWLVFIGAWELRARD